MNLHYPGPRSYLTWRGVACFSVLVLSALLSCNSDRQDRWLTAPPSGPPGCARAEQRCFGERLERCDATQTPARWVTQEDCARGGLVCAPALRACATCVPGARVCVGQQVTVCDALGEVLTPTETCAPENGSACREGACASLCAVAAVRRSNVGCEYWGADLDNANVKSRNVDRIANAAAQQFAIVVSNLQPDVTATVSVFRDDTSVGEPGLPVRVVEAKIAPMNLFVFKLGPREVDGSAPGEFDTGTHTALTRAAYRITSNFPVVAYQFNPLENVNVFSNDASLLKPTEALSMSQRPGEMVDSYVVLGWPQTIGSSEDRNTNFDSDTPVNLRSFLTIVGTRANTTVRVTTRARVVGGGPIPATPIGGTIEQKLDPYDVLNLETGEFGADFTGSLISADGPVVVFSGSEAADVPFFDSLSSRRCCADHLEEQLDPIRTAGTSFVAAVSPSRSLALKNAGATVEVVDQPEVFRVLAVTEGGAQLTTTLPPAGPGTISLKNRGDFVDLTTLRNFSLTSTAPVMLGAFSPSHEAAGIPGGQPGGDPSFVIVPPTQQFRSTYVFLTPDKYSFDFAQIIAPLGARIALDRQPLERVGGCHSATGDGRMGGQLGVPDFPLLVHTCQLSFPRIDENRDPSLSPGQQNDNVHVLEADVPIGLLVSGFDSYVSYGYAGGTELSVIVPLR